MSCLLPVQHVVQAQHATLQCSTPAAIQVKDDIRDAGLCYFHEESRTFALPTRAELAELRVVVATCSAAGLLCHGQYAGDPLEPGGTREPRLRFTHIMIDEAGQVRPLRFPERGAGRLAVQVAAALTWSQPALEGYVPSQCLA